MDTDMMARPLLGTIEHLCGQSYEMVDRISCCLYYQVEGGHHCSSCPHRPQTERIELIQKWLATTAVKAEAAE